MVCYRRPRNLRDLLVRADVSPNTRGPRGSGTCGKRCYNCKRMIRCTIAKSNSRNYEFQIRGNLNCTSYNVIYMIQCNQCRIQYIGQTSNSISSRMTAHVADIKHKKHTTVARHFNSINHSVNDLKVIALTCTSKDLNVRLRHEEAIIQLMGTVSPSGLNIMS